jgi:hypothetical protein
MALKSDFPEIYQNSLFKLGHGPDTVPHCLNLHATMDEMIEAQIEVAKAHLDAVKAQEAPAIIEDVNTSGFG